MDLDFVVERAGHILILETKPAGADVPLGQLITLKAFAKLGCDVWVVWEHESGEVGVRQLGPNGYTGTFDTTTKDGLGDRVLEWRARYA